MQRFSHTKTFENSIFQSILKYILLVFPFVQRFFIFAFVANQFVSLLFQTARYFQNEYTSKKFNRM